MTRASRALIIVALGAAAVAAGAGIVATTAADRLARAAPVDALRWRSTDPAALMALGRQQLAAGDAAAASSSMHRLLAAEPVQGEALAVLATIAAQDATRTGQIRHAQALDAIAARRAPRDVFVHARLMQAALASRRFPDALNQYGLIASVSPASTKGMPALIAAMTQDRDFAHALATALDARPEWRAGVLQALLADKAPASANDVIGELRTGGSLDDGEFREWLDALMRQGQWGAAYSHWASGLDLAGHGLPAVYNGGFDNMPSNVGFDWRSPDVAGVLVDFVPDQGANGLVAHATFLGRSVSRVNLEQPLLLAAGNYRLTARMRAQLLRSDVGLEWAVSCANTNDAVLGTSERVNGSFGWRQVAFDFEVPPECPAQWLRFRNPAASGSAQQVSGELWFDDVAIAKRKP